MPVKIVVKHEEQSVEMEAHPQEVLSSVAEKAAKKLGAKKDKPWTVWALRHFNAMSPLPNRMIVSDAAKFSSVFSLHGVTV